MIEIFLRRQRHADGDHHVQEVVGAFLLAAHLAERLAQLGRHTVESLAESANFITRAHARLRMQVSAAHPFSHPCQAPHGASNVLTEDRGQRDAQEESHPAARQDNAVGLHQVLAATMQVSAQRVLLISGQLIQQANHLNGARQDIGAKQIEVLTPTVALQNGKDVIGQQ